MAKMGIHDPDTMDLNSQIPEDYPELVKELRGIAKMAQGHSKKAYWNMGRYIAKLTDNPNKYGNRTIDNLTDDLAVGYKRTLLYDMSAMYKAYGEKSLTRVLNRTSVSATQLLYLALLPNDQVRDQMERRIEEENMTSTELKHEVRKALGPKTNKDGETRRPKDHKPPSPKEIKTGIGRASKAAKDKKDPYEVWEIANIVAEGFMDEALPPCVQMFGGMKKADVDEYNREVQKAAKKHIDTLNKAYHQMAKYLGAMQKYWIDKTRF